METISLKTYKIYLHCCQWSTWPLICTESELTIAKIWFFDEIFPKRIFVRTLEEADVCISECTAPFIAADKLNIIFCGEGDEHYHYTDFIKSHESTNVKFIGTLEDSNVSFNIPIFCSSWFDIDQLHKYDNKDLCYRYSKNRIHKCFMRHISKAAFTTLREFFALRFNVDYVNGENKLDLISDYIFNFCAENSRSKYNGTEGYITEKVIDAIKANCIPILWRKSIEIYSIQLQLDILF